MTRSRPPLSVILSIAIATSTFFFGSSIAAQACPLTDGGINLSQSVRPDATDESDITRSNATNRSGDSNWQSLDYMGMAGFGVVAGLFAIAILSKISRSRNIAPAEAEFLSRYPQFEHPELILALIPQEALPSTFDTEFSVR